jgi:hypothetical protein
MLHADPKNSLELSRGFVLKRSIEASQNWTLNRDKTMVSELGDKDAYREI